MSGSANLCGYLDRSAAAFPARTAVVDPSGSALTYQELQDQANRIAGWLVERGIKPGDRVGLIAPKSASVVAALFGIMKAGAAYVPADYTAPSERNQTLLADCGVQVVFLHPDAAGVIATWGGGVVP